MDNLEQGFKPLSKITAKIEAVIAASQEFDEIITHIKPMGAQNRSQVQALERGLLH